MQIQKLLSFKLYCGERHVEFYFFIFRLVEVLRI